MNPVSARERRRVLAFAGLVMLLTSLPYLLGVLNQDAEWRYTGTLFAGDDTNSYIALVRRGALGEWLFRTPYSVFPQNGALIYFPYLLAGKPAAPWAGQTLPLHTAGVPLFHIFRLAAWHPLRLLLTRRHLITMARYNG